MHSHFQGRKRVLYGSVPPVGGEGAFDFHVGIVWEQFFDRAQGGDFRRGFGEDDALAFERDE